MREASVMSMCCRTVGAVLDLLRQGTCPEDTFLKPFIICL